MKLLALNDDGKKFVFDMARDNQRTIPTGFHYAVIDDFEEFFSWRRKQKKKHGLWVDIYDLSPFMRRFLRENANLLWDEVTFLGDDFVKMSVRDWQIYQSWYQELEVRLRNMDD